MATPVAWKGVVGQYAGRLNREYEGKETVIIYDYVDRHIPVFDRMYGKRLRAYKQIGYEICTGIETAEAKQTRFLTLKITEPFTDRIYQGHQKRL